MNELIEMVNEEFEEEEIFISGDVLYKDNISGSSGGHLKIADSHWQPIAITLIWMHSVGE
ncbi:hypothetical protein LZZ85_00770 [Terrimonas sp. NA20]|uniref:Uncharacterized protein n=1 Tax=Terrimonas ginsenosidimutans TaxID=2908004 RepID=A0ABS9KKE7_9BACT|nr:hypothetical protein [Terrimonas ginsenosidimutans]MCG2612783.1 hypothetical protein [Terrimonas ginsenosidimutans]